MSETQNNIEKLKQVFEENPEDLQACLQLGQAHLDEFQGESALEVYRKAVRLDPESAEAHLGLGKAFDSLK